MTRLYVSGPMRGYENHNLAEFTRIGGLLHDRGYDVLNPADTRIEVGSARELYLHEDIRLVLVADGVVVMDGWQASPGARIEVAIAWNIGIPTYFIHEHRGDFHLLPLKETSLVIPRENNQHPLIGLCGYAFSGKDTFAQVLTDHRPVRPNEGWNWGDLKWNRVAFADALKAVAKATGWNGAKDAAGRQFLQDLGVGVRDYLDSDAWVRRAEDTMDSLKGPVILTDVRFENEIQMVRRRGGKLVWIERPDVEAVNDHVSEHSVGPEDCDAVFLNAGPLESIVDSVIRFVDWLETSHLEVEEAEPEERVFS